MNGFDKLFDNSDLGRILGMAKTLSKEECRQIYNYMQEHKPKVILEFGVQYGCSTAVFLHISEWLGLDIELHSWDIVDCIKTECVDRDKFSFHSQDVTGKENRIIEEYNPDMIFLDAHPYAITKGLMESCLVNKVDFLCHDVSPAIFERARERTHGFTNKSPETMAEWELYLLGELISPTLLTEDVFENELLKVKCYRDRFGLAVVEIK